jgi:hypothetical protein
MMMTMIMMMMMIRCPYIGFLVTLFDKGGDHV